jgi:hypothetical protein
MLSSSRPDQLHFLRRDKLRQSLKICVMTLALYALTVKAQEKLPLKLVATIPMPGFTGDFDHFGLDLKGNRLFLASEDQKTVEVFDLRTGDRIHSIKGFGQPLTMAYLAELHFMANGRLDFLS